MAVQPEGTPCWADAMFSDLEGAKSFYGDVLGWTFAEASAEYGNYTQAYANGKAVAAVVPPMPGQEGQSQWCLYFASLDAAATAARIRDNGGEVLMEPMQVGDFGTMCLARDPERRRLRRLAGGHPRGLRGDGRTRCLQLGGDLHPRAGEVRRVLPRRLLLPAAGHGRRRRWTSASTTLGERTVPWAG